MRTWWHGVVCRLVSVLCMLTWVSSVSAVGDSVHMCGLRRVGLKVVGLSVLISDIAKLVRLSVSVSVVLMVLLLIIVMLT